MTDETPAAKSTTTRRSTPRKAAPPKRTAKPVEATRVQLDLLHVGETKRFTKWVPDEAATGMSGTLYAPLDATAVKILVVLKEEEAPTA